MQRGTRLEKLNQGEKIDYIKQESWGANQGPQTTKADKWKPKTDKIPNLPQDYYRIQKADVELLMANSMLLNIASMASSSTGTITYPVSSDSNKAYKTHFLKMMNLPHSSLFMKRLHYIHWHIPMGPTFTFALAKL